jgi:small subunit ribosomal protein S14
MTSSKSDKGETIQSDPDYVTMKGKMHFDKLRRIVVANSEPTRLALRYITHNDQLPLQTRMLAQFELGEMPAATSSNRIARRCILSGRGRSIISEFNLSRIRFREQALAGQLIGVKKASW